MYLEAQSGHGRPYQAGPQGLARCEGFCTVKPWPQMESWLAFHPFWLLLVPQFLTLGKATTKLWHEASVDVNNCR